MVDVLALEGPFPPRDDFHGPTTAESRSGSAREVNVNVNVEADVKIWSTRARGRPALARNGMTLVR